MPFIKSLDQDHIRPSGTSLLPNTMDVVHRLSFYHGIPMRLYDVNYVCSSKIDPAVQSAGALVQRQFRKMSDTPLASSSNTRQHDVARWIAVEFLYRLFRSSAVKHVAFQEYPGSLPV